MVLQKIATGFYKADGIMGPNTRKAMLQHKQNSQATPGSSQNSGTRVSTPPTAPTQTAQAGSRGRNAPNRAAPQAGSEKGLPLSKNCWRRK